MQDRYAGDIGDFGKFSLLRSLFASPENTLGVIWYKFPDESHNWDGRHIDYITNPQYRACDLELVQCLSKVVTGERSISHLERLNILPDKTVYFSEALDFHTIYTTQTNAHKTARRNGRLKWLENAINAISQCNIVFADPDNGLEIPSIPNIHQMKSGKYTYFSELEPIFNNKDACVIYHHLNMNESHESQIRFRAQQLKDKMPSIHTVFAIRFWPYSPRAFFVCSTDGYARTMRSKIQHYINGPCRTGWDTYYEA